MIPGIGRAEESLQLRNLLNRFATCRLSDSPVLLTRGRTNYTAGAERTFPTGGRPVSRARVAVQF